MLDALHDNCSKPISAQILVMEDVLTPDNYPVSTISKIKTILE
jgi:3-deoxy-D-arabino-heptulosonate 7-phosphate (DAHP) synthase